MIGKEPLPYDTSVLAECYWPKPPSQVHLTLMADPALQLVTVEQAGRLLTLENNFISR